MKKWIYLLSIFFIFPLCAAEKITILAAASLTNVLDEIKTEYLKTHPNNDIILGFASSSTLARQIEQGAPADIFISADQKWMDYLIDQKIVHHKQLLVANTLVWITQNNNDIPITLSPQKLGTWLKDSIKIAVGDPSHVPAGIYAKEALVNLHIYDQIAPHFINASNVREALLYVELGEAEFGIVYGTDAKISQKVKVALTFPKDSYPKIEYPMALLNKKAQDFYDYLKSKPAQDLFQARGFSKP